MSGIEDYITTIDNVLDEYYDVRDGAVEVLGSEAQNLLPYLFEDTVEAESSEEVPD